MKYNKIIKIILLCSIYLFFNNAVAQNLQTTIDKQNILIGEQIRLKIKATFPLDKCSIQWITMPDSLAHFDVIEKSKIDTFIENSKTVLQQSLILTSFDSGKWATPYLFINVKQLNTTSYKKIYVDTFLVKVNYLKSDSTSQLKDIKPIIDNVEQSYFWYFIVIIILLTSLFIGWYILKNKNKKNFLPSKLSPYNEAIASLEKLEKQNFNDLKQYHIQLTQIFKLYLTRLNNATMMNKTSDELLVYLTENKNLPKKSITDVAIALRIADAAKFAKYITSINEKDQCFFDIKNAIQIIHQKYHS